MKLYYSKGACSLAVRILINELKLPCEYESVDLKTKKTETGADYLKINPKGSVPTFVIETNEILTENANIQMYIADTQKATQLLPPIGDFKRYRVLEWLMFVTTDLHKGCSPLFNPQLLEDAKDVIRDIVKKKLDYLANHLSDRDYLMGDYTLPDGYLFVILSWLPKLKIDINTWPKVAQYFQRLKDRPSIKKSLSEEGLQF